MAKEAEEFIKELKTKSEKEVNDLIKNASSLNNSASLSASELVAQQQHNSNPTQDSSKLEDLTVDSNANPTLSSPSKTSNMSHVNTPSTPKTETQQLKQLEPTNQENNQQKPLRPPPLCLKERWLALQLHMY